MSPLGSPMPYPPAWRERAEQRERMAERFMSDILRYGGHDVAEDLAADACDYADALLDALAERQESDRQQTVGGLDHGKR